MILIITAQVLFFNDFSEKDRHLNAVEYVIAFNPGDSGQRVYCNCLLTRFKLTFYF